MIARSRAAALVSLTIGVGIVAWALYVLSYHFGNANNESAAFDLFFLAVVMIAAGLGLATWWASTVFERAWVISSGAILLCIAHIVRAPSRPYMHDEFGHFYTISGILSGKGLFESNQLVQQSKNYPGFEAAIYGLHEITRLPPYTVGQILIVACHVGMGLAVYSIARPLTGARPAMFASLLFLLSPQVQFVDQLFAYESLGLPLYVFSLAAAMAAARAARQMQRRTYTAISFVLALVNIFVHHLSSFAGIGAVFVFAVLLAVFGRRRVQGVVLLGSSLVLAALAWVWNAETGAKIASYLGVYVDNGIDSLRQRLFGSGGDTVVNSKGDVVATSRTPLSGANYPAYESVATYVTQIVLMILVAAAVIANRRNRNPAWLTCVVLTAGYYVSLPLLFTSGANAAHRSWAFSYLGLAVVAATGARVVLRFVRARTAAWRRHHETRTPTALFPAVAAAVTLVVLSVGFYGAGVNYIEMLPGPYTVGTDGRSAPDSLYRVADWLKHEHAAGKVVLADQRSSYVLEGMAHVVGDPRLDGYLLAPPSITTYYENQTRSYANYIVANSELTRQVSYEGYYFAPDVDTPEPLPRARLTQLDGKSWLHRVYRSGPFTVYEVQPK